jgi:hypothetical protein
MASSTGLGRVWTGNTSEVSSSTYGACSTGIVGVSIAIRELFLLLSAFFE